MSKKDEGLRNVSNIKISDETFIEVKVISIRRKISIQEVIQEIVEREFKKKE